jgi:hypothetical protein
MSNDEFERKKLIYNKKIKKKKNSNQIQGMTLRLLL